ncbi:hypothetical protein [Campylobacter sp.]|uniref:hypothetical protein n=1 Tax=Campylobacter sp. TaxID=205 RepID=UPI00361ABA0B
MQDKNEISEFGGSEPKKEQNLDYKTLATAYLGLFIALALFLPKIYITNQIYYISREIGDLSGKRDVLLEENRELRLKLERMKYKNQILDPLILQ